MAQLLYELCFCLWSVSLCDEARGDFLSCGAVPILAQQVLYLELHTLSYTISN